MTIFDIIMQGDLASFKDKLATLIREKGKDTALNYRNTEGETLLCLAAGHDKPDIVKYLLENGADPNAKAETEAKRSPLDYALVGIFKHNLRITGNTESVRQLLIHGAKHEDIPDLFIAAATGNHKWISENRKQLQIEQVLETPRRHELDNFNSFLVALCNGHHSCIAYLLDILDKKSLSHILKSFTVYETGQRAGTVYNPLQFSVLNHDVIAFTLMLLQLVKDKDESSKFLTLALTLPLRNTAYPNTSIFDIACMISSTYIIKEVVSYLQENKTPVYNNPSKDLLDKLLFDEHSCSADGYPPTIRSFDIPFFCPNRKLRDFFTQVAGDKAKKHLMNAYEVKPGIYINPLILLNCLTPDETPEYLNRLDKSQFSETICRINGKESNLLELAMRMRTYTLVYYLLIHLNGIILLREAKNKHFKKKVADEFFKIKTKKISEFYSQLHPLKSFIPQFDATSEEEFSETLSIDVNRYKTGVIDPVTQKKYTLATTCLHNLLYQLLQLIYGSQRVSSNNQIILIKGYQLVEENVFKEAFVIFKQKLTELCTQQAKELQLQNSIHEQLEQLSNKSAHFRISKQPDRNEFCIHLLKNKAYREGVIPILLALYGQEKIKIQKKMLTLTEPTLLSNEQIQSAQASLETVRQTTIEPINEVANVSPVPESLKLVPPDLPDLSVLEPTDMKPEIASAVTPTQKKKKKQEKLATSEFDRRQEWVEQHREKREAAKKAKSKKPHQKSHAAESVVRPSTYESPTSSRTSSPISVTSSSSEEYSTPNSPPLPLMMPQENNNPTHAKLNANEFSHILNFMHDRLRFLLAQINLEKSSNVNSLNLIFNSLKGLLKSLCAIDQMEEHFNGCITRKIICEEELNQKNILYFALELDWSLTFVSLIRELFFLMDDEINTSTDYSLLLR